MTEQSGTVKWFNNSKGYGFIEDADGEDVFVHYREILFEGYRTLREGQIVKYVLDRGPKGWRAKNVALNAELLDGRPQAVS